MRDAYGCWCIIVGIDAIVNQSVITQSRCSTDDYGIFYDNNCEKIIAIYWHYLSKKYTLKK